MSDDMGNAGAKFVLQIETKLAVNLPRYILLALLAIPMRVVCKLAFQSEGQ